MWSLGWKQFMPFILTIIVILLTDLLIGVSIGLLLSVYFILQNNFKAEYKITKKVVQGIETEYIKLNSNVTFLNKVKQIYSNHNEGSTTISKESTSQANGDGNGELLTAA